jgi:hypothetical protein
MLRLWRSIPVRTRRHFWWLLPVFMGFPLIPPHNSIHQFQNHCTDARGVRWMIQAFPHVYYAHFDLPIWSETNAHWESLTPGVKPVPPFTWDAQSGPPVVSNGVRWYFPNDVKDDQLAAHVTKATELARTSSGLVKIDSYLDWRGLAIQTSMLLAAGMVVLLVVAGFCRLVAQHPRACCQRCGYPLVRQKDGRWICPECGPGAAGYINS